MNLSCQIGNHTHQFKSLKELLAKASPARSGDALAGIAAANMEERLAAQTLLADLPLDVFLEQPLVPYEEDEVTRLIIDRHDAKAFAPVRNFSVGDLRDWLLSDLATENALKSIANGLTPEMVAAVSKLMRNQDLILVAAKCNVVTSFRNTLDLPGSLAVRLQPNHPIDDPKGVLASTLDGLMYGTGDACIGVNPVSDDPSVLNRIWRMLDDFISHYEIPTQSCVLTHVTRQIDAMEQGLPVDLVFQSIAGTEAANKGFGINLALLKQAHQAALELGRGTVGNNVMYFETGQGSALSSNSHHGMDQQTCEARAYAVAREFNPLLVNTVVGFIGPEYLYDGRQITRAGLEDHFCGKLLGLPMGVDVCYTNHAEADQNDMDILLTVLGAAGVNYIMGVPGSDDVMLGYQTTSFHDALYLRKILNKRMAPEFEEWLQKMQIMDADLNLLSNPKAVQALMNFAGAANDQ